MMTRTMKACFWMLVSCAFGSMACAFASLAVLFADAVEVAPAEPASGAEALAVVERDEGAEGDETRFLFERLREDVRRCLRLVEKGKRFRAETVDQAEAAVGE